MYLAKYLISFLLLPSLTYAQYKNVKVNTVENRPNEVTIAINPLNNLNLTAGANIDNYYWSTDGGNSWSNGTIKSEDYGVWGDPCVIFDYLGNSYYFHLARPSPQQWLDRIVCHRSTNGGISWEEPGTYTGLNPPRHQDKDWACADFLRKNNIYVTWTQFDRYGSKDPEDKSNIYFSRSTNNGVSWNEAIRINEKSGDCRDSANTVEGAVPCVGPKGEIYTAWSGPEGIVFQKSINTGTTWLANDIFVDEQVKGWDYDVDGIYRCNGMPITGCDISGSPYRGTIYINFSDRRNGDDDVDIFLVKSSDGGNTWNKVIRVNDDPVGNKKQQFMSWMSVDPVSGAINILFYDRRSYNDLQTDVYLARSTDGGESFKNIKISENPFVPSKKIFFGDYIGISSYNDFVACIWQRLEDKKISVMYCGIDFKK